MRYLWLFLSSVLLALSLLTTIPAPTLLGWKLALLAGEWGHVLALGALLLFVFGIWRRGFGLASRTLVRVMLTTNFVALVLLLKPSFQAWKISTTLRERMAHGFPPTMNSGAAPVFRWRDLYRIGTGPTVISHSYVYAAPEGRELHLDFYPANPAVGLAQTEATAPCIVVVHGGGWNNGDRTQLPALNSWLAERGYAVATIDYRLAPHWLWPAPREDTESALHWLQRHAAELKIDPRRFVLLGRSAGGQIALATAYGQPQRDWRGVICLYGPSDLNFGYESGRENDALHSRFLLRNYLGGPPEAQPARYRDASAYAAVRPDLPPTLLIHGKLDTLVWYRHSERLDAALTTAQVPHLYVSLPWATHAFDFNLNGPGGQLTRNLIEIYLQTILRETSLRPFSK